MAKLRIISKSDNSTPSKLTLKQEYHSRLRGRYKKAFFFSLLLNVLLITLAGVLLIRG